VNWFKKFCYVFFVTHRSENTHKCGRNTSEAYYVYNILKIFMYLLVSSPYRIPFTFIQ